MPGPGPHASNPNIRVGADGSEYVDPIADLGEFLFSWKGLAAVVGADLLLTGGDLLGAGMEFGGDVLGAAGDGLDVAGGALSG